MHEIARGHAGLTGGALMRQAIGIDLGGSHVSAAVVDEQGRIGAKHARDLVDLSPDAVVDGDRRRRASRAPRRARTRRRPASGSVPPGTSTMRPARSATRRTSTGPTSRSVRACSRRSGVRYSSPTTPSARRSPSTRSAPGAGRSTSSCSRWGRGSAAGSLRTASWSSVTRRAPARSGTIRFGPHDGFVCGCGKIGCFEAQASATG